jgi:hypothetical protein
MSMTTMNLTSVLMGLLGAVAPAELVKPAAPLPAPVWFVQFFKVLGFALHSVPMSLWYAGLPIALGLHLRGDAHGRRCAARLLQQMPVIVAVGVNLGIVPLLFLQLAYGRFFYSATILMAWFWLAIIALLIPAYYAIYIYAWALRRAEPARWKIAAGWLAALFFLCIGFIFANGMSLTEHVARWPGLWSENSLAGAALGTALNTGDAMLWPRWLMMFSLAICTTAAWIVFDAQWLTRGTVDADYRRRAWSLAAKLHTVGLVLFAATGSWYVFGTWPAELRETMFAAPYIWLTLPTAAALGLPWLLIVGNKFLPGGLAAALVALAQFAALSINAVSRQAVQNLKLQPYYDVYAQPAEVQTGPLAMFLIAFVVGACVVGWMIMQVRKSKPA